MVLPDIISGNLTATLSDHFPQFLIAPSIFLNSSIPRVKTHMKEIGQDLINKILLLFFN